MIGQRLRFYLLAACFFTCRGADPLYFEPWETRMLYMVCEVSPGVYLQNCNLSASVSAVANTGGHSHGGDPRYGNPRNGSLSPASGNTGSQGFVSTYFSATRIAQTETVRVCAGGGGCTDTTFYVRQPGLAALSASDNYILVGATAAHPSNHYFTASANNSIVGAIQDYVDTYQYDPAYLGPVAVNDSSLPTGGVFDICALNSNCLATTQNPSGGVNPWGGPHQSPAHDRGNAVDIRANGGRNSIIDDQTVKNAFMQFCRNRGFTFVIQESVGTGTEHIHCER
jgi:hypothetical protein